MKKMLRNESFVPKIRNSKRNFKIFYRRRICLYQCFKEYELKTLKIMWNNENNYEFLFN